MENPEQEPFDLDEDLFAFDEVERELSAENERDESLEEIFASYRDEDVRTPHPADELAVEASFDEPAELTPELDEAPELLPAPTVERPARAASPARPAPAPAPRPSARESAAPARLSAEVAHEPAPEPEARPRRAFPRLPRGMVAIALSVTLLNGLLGVVLLRGNARMRDEVRAVGHESGDADAGVARAESLAPPSVESSAFFDAEAHPAFVEARDEIARGEYAAARQRIYALLAIIDRLEDPRREAVEAEAQFVLAQTLHLEALERMGTAR